MKKITRQQRLDLLRNGFYRCGYIEKAENIEEYIHSSRLTDQLTETFADIVREKNTYLSIAKIRSKDFIDSDGCYYDFKGKTYQHGQFLVHIYPSSHSTGGIASLSLLAE